MKLINPQRNWKRLKKAYNLPKVRSFYHHQMVCFAVETGWEEGLGEDYTERVLQDYHKLTYPARWDSSDWRFFKENGDERYRLPEYFDFVCGRSCHWRAAPDLVVASIAFPSFSWYIIESDDHTAVVERTHKFMFDPTFFAIGSTAIDAYEMIYEQPDTVIRHEVGEVPERRFDLDNKTVYYVWSSVNDFL